MRSISILGFAAATIGAALLASTAAEAGGRRGGFAPHAGAGFQRNFARPSAFHRPAWGGGVRRHVWGGGYRHVHHGWRRRGVGYGIGAAVGAAVGYGVANAYESGYGYAEPSYGYAAPTAGYYSAPASRSWSRSYLVPQTVVQPVTHTELVPVTTYKAVQSTQYVPRTVYRQVTQTCSCTTDGVTREVPCAGGYSGGASYGVGVSYNRPGLFTSHW